jgi:ABC-type amino acid transport substrate-binding protein
MKLRINFKAIFSLVLILILSVSCSEQQTTPATQKTRLSVAIDSTFIPMAFINDNGQIDGFEPSLIKEIIKEAGYEMDLVDVEWGGLFGGLATKKFDLLISSITILEERKKRMAFSVPYIRSGVAILVRNDFKDIKSLTELEKTKTTVGAQINTTAYFYLEKFPGLQRKGYEKTGHALLDLVNGGLSAVLGDTAQIHYFYHAQPDLKNASYIAGERLTSENYGIVFRKEDKVLREEIDKALIKLIRSGRVRALADKWKLGEIVDIPDPSTH